MCGRGLSVQKTVAVGMDQGWAAVVSRQGIACWLGKTNQFSLAEGKTFKTDDGISGEIRVLKPGNRVRLTWQKPRMKRHAILQITLTETTSAKTRVGIHLERLSSQAVREEMKKHWKLVLEKLAELAVS